MKFKSPMLVVADMDQAVAFYEKVLGLHVVMDFGANKTLTGGLCLQTLETWKAFIGTNAVAFGGNNAEIYFEEDDFDRFAEKLTRFDLEYVHPIREHAEQRNDAGAGCGTHGCTNKICQRVHALSAGWRAVPTPS